MFGLNSHRSGSSLSDLRPGAYVLHFHLLSTLKFIVYSMNNGYNLLIICKALIGKSIGRPPARERKAQSATFLRKTTGKTTRELDPERYGFCTQYGERLTPLEVETR
jgi:hypothetical protein